MERPKTWQLLVIVVGALLLTSVVLWLLVDYSRSAPVEKQFPITIAILGLIGTLWTGAITFVGLLLKDSLDRRNLMLQTESEKRLRMEAALKAIEVMSGKETEGVSMQESREAAILLISSLDQLHLALTMAEQLLSRDKISPGSLARVAELCLSSDDVDLQCTAAYTLRMSALKLVESKDELAFPWRHVHGWTGNLPPIAKENLLLALATSLLSKEFTYWNYSILTDTLYAFYKIFLNESERRYKCVGAVFAKDLSILLERKYPGYGMMPADRDVLAFQEIRQVAEEALRPFGAAEDNIGSEDLDLLHKMQKWMNPDGADPVVPTTAPPVPPATVRPHRSGTE